jgi:hypothetical protein
VLILVKPRLQLVPTRFLHALLLLQCELETGRHAGVLAERISELMPIVMLVAVRPIRAGLVNVKKVVLHGGAP